MSDDGTYGFVLAERRRYGCAADDLIERAQAMLNEGFHDPEAQALCRLVRDLAEQLSRVQLAGFPNEWVLRDAEAQAALTDSPSS